MVWLKLLFGVWLDEILTEGVWSRFDGGRRAGLVFYLYPLNLDALPRT